MREIGGAHANTNTNARGSTHTHGERSDRYSPSAMVGTHSDSRIPGPKPYNLRGSASRAGSKRASPTAHLHGHGEREAEGEQMASSTTTGTAAGPAYPGRAVPSRGPGYRVQSRADEVRRRWVARLLGPRGEEIPGVSGWVYRTWSGKDGKFHYFVEGKRGG